LLGKRLTLEVDWRVSQILRNSQAARFDKLSLPLLRGGVIDLKNTQAQVRIAMREGIEPRTQENVLRNAPRNCLREHVFRITAASDQEGAKPHRERPVSACGRALQLL
jgi:hypothetical protein